jgi:signal transduction histidine kinase
MGFNGLVTPRQLHVAPHSAREFAGIELNTDLDAQGKGHVAAERTRIAQELHDTPRQGFFAMSMQLQDAVDHLRADSPAKLRFGGLLRAVERAVDEGRRAVRSLRSAREIFPSLGEAFASVPNDLGFHSAGFRVVVHGRERELTAGLRDELYRIAREAIVNACRHSRARDIETEVEYRPTELRIIVRDNGCGIDPQGLRWGRNGHRGLEGMRERAERIGARLRVWSGVGVGTEVELCVPGRIAFERGGTRAYGKDKIA